MTEQIEDIYAAKERLHEERVRLTKRLDEINRAINLVNLKEAHQYECKFRDAANEILTPEEYDKIRQRAYELTGKKRTPAYANEEAGAYQIKFNTTKPKEKGHNMFKELAKAVVGTVILPIDAAKDVITLGGAITNEPSAVAERCRKIAKNLDKATD